MISVECVSSWDLIETPARNITIVVFPGPRPVSVLAAADGLFIGTQDGPRYLVGSANLSTKVSGARSVVVAEADEAIVRETLVQVRVDDRSFIIGDIA